MAKLCLLITFSAVLGLISAAGLLENIVVPSLKDFGPEDSGCWIYKAATFKFAALPIPQAMIPHYEVEVELSLLRDGKQLDWVACIGDGTVVGRIVDSESEKYSTCEIGEKASGLRDPLVQRSVVGFCSTIRSMRRTKDDRVQVVVFFPSGAESVYFERGGDEAEKGEGLGFLNPVRHFL